MADGGAPLRRYAQIEQFDFHHRLAEAPGVSLIFFSRPACGSCQRWAVLLQEFLKQRLDIRILEVNAERDPALIEEFEVFHLPALFIYKDGEYFGQLQGEARLDALSQGIESALRGGPQDPP